MKNIKIYVLFLSTFLLWAMAHARTSKDGKISDDKVIEKYCKDGKGEFIVNIVNATDKDNRPITIERPSLKCDSYNSRFRFEILNEQLKLKNSETLGDDFFTSKPWQDYMKNTVLKAAKARNDKCTEVNIVNGSYLVTCGDEVLNMSDEVKGRTFVYSQGREAFKNDPDKTELIKYYDEKTTITVKQEKDKEEIIVTTGNENTLIGDNTVITNDNEITTLPDENQNFKSLNPKIKPYQTNSNDIKFTPQTVYEYYVSTQTKQLIPDYAEDLRKKFPEISYLDVGSPTDDIFTKYNIETPTFTFDSKINMPFGLQNKFSPMGVGHSIGSSPLVLDKNPPLNSVSGNILGVPSITSTSNIFEIPSFEENTSFLNHGIHAFGDIPQKTTFNLNTGTGGFGNISSGFGNVSSGFGNISSGFGSLNTHKGFTGIGSFSGSSIIPIGNNGVVKDEHPINDENIVNTPVKSDNVIPIKVVEDKVNEDPNCEEELSKALAALLEKDDQNIIGLQFELTVLKVASAVVGNKNKTLEGMIRQQTKIISETDKGKIIEGMGALYKKHGLIEDQTKLEEHLKTKYENFSTKAASANYYAGDKRFFNEESSAFLMAYQHLNPESGIKEADVSVLWFMDKVSEKAKGQWSKYSAGHNLTNLSTRVAYYTGGINPDKAISKEKLDEMVKTQKGKIDKELLALIEDFKTTNQACYEKLFSDTEKDCNLGVVEDSLSKLLAVSSKIESTDLISLDGYMKGNFDKKRFQISRYVEPVMESAE